jgi:hypothetical protein
MTRRRTHPGPVYTRSTHDGSKSNALKQNHLLST